MGLARPVSSDGPRRRRRHPRMTRDPVEERDGEVGTKGRGPKESSCHVIAEGVEQSILRCLCRFFKREPHQDWDHRPILGGWFRNQGSMQWFWFESRLTWNIMGVITSEFGDVAAERLHSPRGSLLCTGCARAHRTGTTLSE